MRTKILGLAHVGIPTSDVEKSIAFYEQLGFKLVVMRRNLENHHFAFMEQNGCTIGLPESLSEDKNGAGKRTAGAIDHFALFCEDIEALYQEMKDAGYTILTDGITSTAAWEPKRCRCFMIQGPDNVRIEFCQIT